MNEQPKQPGCLARLIKGFFKWMLIILAISYFSMLVDEFKDSDSKQSVLPTARPTFTQASADYLPGVPTSLQSHQTLSFRGKGDCEALVGDIVVLSLFVTDPYSDWTDEQRQSVKNDQAHGIANIEAEAARYGVTLSILPQYMDVYAPNQTEEPRSRDMDMDAYADAVLAAAGLPGQDDLIDSLKELYDTDEAAVMFYTDTVGTSEAYVKTSGSGFEHTFMFRDTAAFQHELFHLFGAYDLYSPAELKEAAKAYFGESIMINSSNPYTDPLTAYTIGWTNTPDTTATDFLYATAHITPLEYTLASAARPMDGYGTTSLDNGSYSGQFVNGKFHGWGTYTWNDGSIYEGNWDNGQRTGQGTLLWADGSKYAGYFDSSQREGYGVMTWADGTVYEGSWLDNEKSGYGVMRWANGNSYQGTWSNDERNGHGTLRWASGGSYDGDWVNGQQHGYGITYWSNGAKHSGHWENGQLHGYGTYTYPNGRVVKGYWVNGEYRN